METRASFIGQNIITPEIMEELSVGRHCLDLAVFALDYSVAPAPRSIPLASNVHSFTAWTTHVHYCSAGTLMYASLQYRYQVLLDDCIDRLEAMAPARTAFNDERARTPLASSASSPSLRSRTAVARPMTPPNNMTPGGNVKVVVRVRGFLPREVDRGAQCLIEMDPDTQQTRLLIPPSSDPANAKTQSRKITRREGVHI